MNDQSDERLSISHDFLWSTGVKVDYSVGAGWAATLEWQSSSSLTEGVISTYSRASTLAESIDMVMNHVEAMNILFINMEAPVPVLWYQGDGDSPQYVPPENWRELLREEAQKRGWITYRQDRIGYESFHEMPRVMTLMGMDEGLVIEEPTWIELSNVPTKEELLTLMESEEIRILTKDYPVKEKARIILLEKVKQSEEPIPSLLTFQVFNRFGNRYIDHSKPFGLTAK